MRKLGVIGGMSWASTAFYYERINRLIQRQLPPPTSAPVLIESLDFKPLCGITDEQDWDRAAKVLSLSARRLERAGAKALVIAANSMHHVYDHVAAQVNIPIFHIADCVGRAVAQDGVRNAALLGTRNVMIEPFYRDRLVACGVDLFPPDMDFVERLDTLIYGQLMVGNATRDAQRELKTIITAKQQDGAEAIILACTELQMVVTVDPNILPIYDSASLHCKTAAQWILGEDDVGG